MGVVEVTDTVTSPIAAPKLFKGWCVDSHTIVPKVAPHQVKSIAVDGNGGPGTTHHITFSDAAPVKYVKLKIDVCDENTLTYADTVVEGGELSEKILKVTHELKFEASPDGGCSVTIVAKFYLQEGTTLSEEEIKASKEGPGALFKAVEAYLLEN